MDEDADVEPTPDGSPAADGAGDDAADGADTESGAEPRESGVARGTTTDTTAQTSDPAPDVPSVDDGPSHDAPNVPEDVRKYARFKKMDGAQYERVNEFLRDRTYITAREWAIARLCSDFRTETGVEMTKIGEHLPRLVPFMTDTYTPQAVNQARSAFDDKVRKAGATFLYGAMCDFYTAEELDDVMYEVTEVAKFLLEVEGVDLTVEEELDAEERISSVMREVREASRELRTEDLTAEADETDGEDDEDSPESAVDGEDEPDGEVDGGTDDADEPDSEADGDEPNADRGGEDDPDTEVDEQPVDEPTDGPSPGEE